MSDLPELKKEQILALDDLPIEWVEVPEWNCRVRIKSMSARRRVTFNRLVLEDDDNGRVLLAAFSVVGEDGELMFSVEDVQALAEKNAFAIWRISDAAMRLSATSQRALEEARERFLASQSGDLLSD